MNPDIQAKIDEIVEAFNNLKIPIEGLPYYSESLRRVAGDEQAKLNIVGRRFVRYMLLAIAPFFLLLAARLTVMQASFLLQEISAIVQGETR